MNANSSMTRDMQKSLANKGFPRPSDTCARVMQACGATEMLDRKRWFLSDCQVLLHYLGVSSTIEHVRVARQSRCTGDARSRATRAQARPISRTQRAPHVGSC